MDPLLSGAVYLTIWWVVFLGILPLGTISHFEAGIDKGDGGDPGAPVDPKLGRKFITTTWVSAIPFSALWIAMHFHWLSLPNLPTGG
jgi:predicted secreted protein